jgi:uncharacterized protein YpuA (DUF1002 family)
MILDRRFIVALVFASIIVSAGLYSRLQTVPAGGEKEKPRVVIAMGEDLNTEQENSLMQYFGDWKRDKDTRVIRVSNSEERAYLQGVVEERLIGSRAISSAYVELLDKNKGIEVSTHNITAITPFMYANALTTAGSKDARIIVAAPFEVSGTAALTGIIKAFESVSGEKLSESAKETAHQEMAETSRLAQELGESKAEKFIYEVKRKVIENRSSDPEEIRKIILDISAELNVKLSEESIDRMVLLMQRINGLKISVEGLNEQLKSLERSLGDIRNTGREAANFFEEILAELKSLIEKISTFLA